MKWYWRLLLSAGIAISGGVVALLALAVLELYLAGHGQPTLGSMYIDASKRLSVSDVVILAVPPLCGLFAWCVLRGVGRAD